MQTPRCWRKPSGASVQNSEGSVIIRTEEKPSPPTCEKVVVEGEHFSEQLRSDVAGVADEIESLRAAVLKMEKVALGPRFDAIDRELTLSTAHVQTDADTAAYYAVSYASNSLAISYYKESRGVRTEEAQKNQLDSMLCAMESKFAPMKGVLLPGGSCNVSKRMEAQPPPKRQKRQSSSWLSGWSDWTGIPLKPRSFNDRVREGHPEPEPAIAGDCK